MNIYIVRHGETAKNKEKLLQGRSNSPLNENGIRQAEKARDFLRSQNIRLDRICSSPLTRAAQTGKIIAGNDVPLLFDDRLLEMDYGPYEGTCLANPPREIITFFQDFVHNPAPEGMESLAHVTERMGEFLQDILSDKDENVLIATHAIAMKGALEYLTPDAEGMYWAKYVGNCDIYMAETLEDGYSVPHQIFEI